jgi:chromosome segregation protein
MRLATLRLAGFKSFVDPTELHFPCELVGIVGPNGCGKSNTLDALRWVMGESSAKHLRGQSLDDVIFAGSGQRKPVAQASVELVFEHHDESGALQGPWARFRDLSIRRVSTRDGQSKYFLNGTRCRRKDIADLFLGTGLGRGHGSTSGTRSYAIIEQGQINRLLDARPEELRATLEEAAGISRYKERRRETEISIQHTRDNLTRLNDLRDELSRQLDKLERQAKAAERFRLWQHEAAQFEIALHSLQLQQLHSEREHELTLHAEEQAQLDETQRQQQQCLLQLEASRARDTDLQTHLHQAQTKTYALAADVAQLEQTRRHHFEQAEQIERELQQLAQESAQHAQHSAEAQTYLAQLVRDIEAAEAALAPLTEQVKRTNSALEAAEQRTQDTRAAFERLQSQAQEPAQQLHVQRSQLAHSVQQQRSLHERLQRLSLGRLESETQTLERDAEAARAAHLELSQRVNMLETMQDHHTETLASARQALTDAGARLGAMQAEISAASAEQRALVALEQAQSNEVSPSLRIWLKQHGLEHARAAEQVSAAAEWLETLDAVLADALNAVPVESLDAWLTSANVHATHGLWLVERDVAASCAQDSAALLHGDYALALLNGLHPSPNLETALAGRHELQPGEAWLTPQGDRVSRHLWQRPPAPQGNHGTLKRRQRLEQLASELERLHPSQLAASEQLTTARHALAALEGEHSARQREHREALRQQGELALRSEQLRLRLEQSQNRLRGQRREHEELHEELHRGEQRRNQLQQRVDELERALRTHETELHAARSAREQAEQEVARLRQRVRDAERAEQAAQSRLHALQREHGVRGQALAHIEAQGAHLATRQHALLERQRATLAPQAELGAQLECARTADHLASTELEHARRTLAAHTDATRSRHEALLRAEQTLEQARTDLANRLLRLQALELRAEVPAARLADIAPSDISRARGLVNDLDIPAVQARLHDTQARIARLGAVNLAALEEYEQARLQHAAMEAQHADLNEALATLETAMHTMDQDTRARFRETFEAVNAKLGETFQQLFGGGEARLELQGDAQLAEQDDPTQTKQDRWLDRGVVLLARPPGKKISHIHLLSGGEKSLTAIALVFAIFQLNPAPFCLLDEVDAPLDEANVGRFCAMVQAMSARVQFIFITHNKTTMELARHLIGVTMREAGVSRIVEVDLDAAVKMLDE